MVFTSDNCHKYDIHKLDKNIYKYPVIKIDKKYLVHILKESSSHESNKPCIFKNISNMIVLFNDFKPLSNWIDELKTYYKYIIKNTKTKYISCILIQYIDMRSYILRLKNPLIYRKKSTIHGKGTFALEDISKGINIMKYIDQIQGNEFIYDDSYLINHSSKNPNVYLKYYNNCKCKYSMVVSKKKIKKNEELLINYLDIEKRYQCLGGIIFTSKE